MGTGVPVGKAGGCGEKVEQGKAGLGVETWTGVVFPGGVLRIEV